MVCKVDFLSTIAFLACGAVELLIGTISKNTGQKEPILCVESQAVKYLPLIKSDDAIFTPLHKTRLNDRFCEREE